MIGWANGARPNKSAQENRPSLSEMTEQDAANTANGQVRSCPADRIREVRQSVSKKQTISFIPIIMCQ